MKTPKFPQVSVQLTGSDGNAFAILGRVQAALRRAKVSEQDRAAFMKEATGGDYHDLLATCMKWVDVN